VRDRGASGRAELVVVAFRSYEGGVSRHTRYKDPHGGLNEGRFAAQPS
jgi:hypothetical protein